MISFSDITPHDLDAGDIELLVKVGRRAYDNAEASFFVRRALDKQMKFIRIEGDIRGLIGLEKHETSKGLELWVSFIAGKGAMKHVREIWKGLQKVQDDLGAVTIATMAPCVALARIYERQIGLRPVAMLFREEVK